jgi:hypothetical protein
MAGVDVVVVALQLGSMVYWKIKRWAPGRPFLGWARGDGTFTAGISPTFESSDSEIWRTSEYAVEFAEEQRCNVVGVISR